MEHICNHPEKSHVCLICRQHLCAKCREDPCQTTLKHFAHPINEGQAFFANICSILKEPKRESEATSLIGQLVQTTPKPRAYTTGTNERPAQNSQIVSPTIEGMSGKRGPQMNLGSLEKKMTTFKKKHIAPDCPACEKHNQLNIQPLIEFFMYISEQIEEIKDLTDPKETSLKDKSESRIKMINSLFSMSEPFLEEFQDQNNFQVNECSHVTNYAEFLIVVMKSLHNSLRKMSLVINGSKDAEAKTLLFGISLLCRPLDGAVVFKKIGDYYNQVNKIGLYSLFTHFFQFGFSTDLTEDSSWESFTYLEQLINYINSHPQYNNNDFKLVLSDNLIQKIYRFCVVKGEPLFSDLLNFCHNNGVTTRWYKSNNSWEKFSKNLLKKIVEDLKENVYVLNTSSNERTLESIDAETLYNFKVIINNNFTKPRLQVEDRREVIIMILLAHEVCHIAKSYLLGNGDLFLAELPPKYSVTKPAMEKWSLSKPQEIGFYFEETCLFGKNLTQFEVFSPPDKLVEILRDEARWGELTAALPEIFSNTTPSDAFPNQRKKPRTKKHFSFYKMEKLRQKSL